MSPAGTTSDMHCYPTSEAFGHRARIFDLDFHPSDCGILASASEDGSVRIWRSSSCGAAWKQVDCCIGHQDEVLRVAWSPDGRLLSSGGADGTVRMWRPSCQLQTSYAGHEVCVLPGHPEEVYALTFLTSPLIPPPPSQVQPLQPPTVHTPPAAPPSPAAAAAGQEQPSSGDLLVAGSGESLFLWDYCTQQLLQEVEPATRVPHRLDWRPPVQPPPPGAAATAATTSHTAVPATEQQGPTTQQHQQQLGVSATAAADGEEEEEDDTAPAYVFALSQSPALQLLATSSSDGVVRLFEARCSSRSLTEVAAALAHPDDMGTCCAFSHAHPHQLVSCSKGGELLLLDLRQLAAPLQLLQLPGPVMDVAVRQSAAGSGEQLLVVGCDASIRCLTWQHGRLTVLADSSAAAGGGSTNSHSAASSKQDVLQGGGIGLHLLSAPTPYSASLLAVATSADGSRVAAAGAAVLLPRDATRTSSSSGGGDRGQASSKQAFADAESNPSALGASAGANGPSSASAVHSVQVVMPKVTSGVAAMHLDPHASTPQQQQPGGTPDSTTAQQQHQGWQKEAPQPAAGAAAAVAVATVRRRRGAASSAPGVAPDNAAAAADDEDLFGDLELLQASLAPPQTQQQQQHNPEHHQPEGARAPIFFWA